MPWSYSAKKVLLCELWSVQPAKSCPFCHEKLFRNTFIVVEKNGIMVAQILEPQAKRCKIYNFLQK